MSGIRGVVSQALHDTRRGGTAVLGAHGGARGVVQWICFGNDGWVIEVPDPALPRPGRLRRRFRRSARPAGLDDDQILGLKQLGFTPGEHGHEREIGPAELGHDQLVHVIVGALETVGLDGHPVSVETF